MAHKGKLYPVIFRRDLNLNVETNDHGWSNRVIVVFPRLPTGLAGFWSFTHWDTGPGHLSARRSALWVSDIVLKFGLHWFVEVEAVINSPGDFTRLLRLNTQELGITAEWLLLLNHWHSPDWQMPFVPTVLQSFDPGFFDFPPTDMFGLTIRPKFWSEGEPH